MENNSNITNEVIETEGKAKKTKKPKKVKFNYFDSLIRMSEFAQQEAALFVDFVNRFSPAELAEKKAAIHALEHACDLEKHELTRELVKDFLPPIERDDLFHLAHVVDNLADSIDNIMSELYILNITELRADATKFAELIKTCCGMVGELLAEFHNFKKSTTLRDLIIALNDVEEQGDRLHADSMHTLSCEEGIDTRTLVEWRELYNQFEECFDAAESIADNVESVVMKNS